MRLSIVIPALNEEEAIGQTLRACLDAAPGIAAEAALSGVEVLVVDDGSTDRTAEIARGFPEVRLLQHPVNRGYGAAIRTGFTAARGELLSFLDADGTCDPRWFGKLARVLQENGADVVTGSRLAKENRMPVVRRLGNRLFAFLVNLVSPQRVEDLASGMRVLRREVLPRLEPLPDGLHYTPAMSAKALFDRDVRLVEVPMPYAERIGASKLSVLEDGQRFLRVLGEIAFSYRPFLFFGTPGLACLAVAAGYSVGPALVLARGDALAEDMIYRLYTIVVLAVAGFSLVATGLVAVDATAIVHGRRPTGAIYRACDAILMRHPFVLGTVLIAAALFLDRRAIASYVSEGRIHEHWFWVVAGGLLVLTGIELFAFGALKKILVMLAERRVARFGAGEPHAEPRREAVGR